MLFLILVLAQLIIIPLVAISILRNDKKDKTPKLRKSHWQEVQLVDLPEGIITSSSDGASRPKQRR